MAEMSGSSSPGRFRTPYDCTSLSGSVPGTFLVPNFGWRYHLFLTDIEHTAGTLIPFPRETASQAARDVNRFARGEDPSQAAQGVNRFARGADPEFLQAVKIMETTPNTAAAEAEVLFPRVVVRWSEWLKEILKEEKEPANAVKIGLYVYRQLYKSVRRRFENKEPTFLRLKDSFGIDQANRVLFFAAPSGGDFHSNIMELSEMSLEILYVLKGVLKPDLDTSVLKTINAATDLLIAFYRFIQSEYCTWIQKRADERTKQWFALNHPLSYDLPETVRYFINLGRLGDRLEALNLCRNRMFCKQMGKLIPKWMDEVKKDHNLKKILEYSVSQARGGNQSSTTWNCRYNVEDIPLYASNGMKHFWQNVRVGEKKRTKAEVISHLETFIPGLSYKMYKGYAKAVIEGGYNHDLFDAVFVLSKDT